MSFPRYEAYKDSGVEWLGELPRHWSLAPIKRMFSVIGGSTPKSDSENLWDGGIPWVTPADLSQLKSIYVDETGRTISEAGLASCGTSLVPSGSIILSTRAPIGSIAIAAMSLCTNQGCRALVPMSHGSSIFYFFVLTSAVRELNVRGKGTTFLELSADELASFRVPIPPHAERSAIAAFLDRETTKIDTLVQEQQRLIELLKEKRQAVISHAVTKGLNPHAPMKDSGVEWLGEVPKHWQISRVKFIKAAKPNAFVDGPFGSNLKSEHYIEGGDVYVIESSFATQGTLDTEGLKTISMDHFATIERSEAKPNDIIIAKIGAQFGKSAILPEIDRKAVVSGNSLKLTVNDTICDNRFVCWQLVKLKQIGAIDEIVNATAQPALSLGEMNNLPILVPSVGEQQEIVSYLNRTLVANDALIAEAEATIALLQERRSALISAAVTGKIDVRGLASLEAEAA
ncbi:restriction endonuclease subunit S [Methylocystis sp. L43]|uniref:restriction endonuclease subunit S n=1 Tax=unclassified Methylocystis TaxID=2625913 RepID=UPI0018C2948A|nr:MULTISPECIES: restriction endonuclease subunit S [unclassified Methylocystis]MBG0798861.1 restriction endonuclease subunit S [Methylocystis sp. L43]MBG0806368.1 restriction endonuclease subunit S [Methylocystis sp. H15]